MIIFLNGVGSAGKTSIAKSIQYLSHEPWLRLGVDTLIDMLPDRYVGFGDKATEGYFSFITGENNRGPLTRVQSHPQGNQVFLLLPQFAKMLADQGHHLIIDEVLLGDNILKAYVQALAQHTTYFIGVFCNLNLMQEREILRGDRVMGLANDQIDRVHQGTRPYDLAVDTSYQSSFESANQIINFIDSSSQPTGFAQITID